MNQSQDVFHYPPSYTRIDLMHSCFVLFFLSISIVIYFHIQVLDGQRKIINLLQEQIENVRLDSP